MHLQYIENKQPKANTHKMKGNGGRRMPKVLK